MLQDGVTVARAVATDLDGILELQAANQIARGGMLSAESSTDKTLKEEGDCNVSSAPMSTFKLAISLMGYDAGILQDEHQPVWPFKLGYTDCREEWKQDIDPAMWMSKSVVWYSQQITSKLGDAQFSKYTHQFR